MAGQSRAQSEFWRDNRDRTALDYTVVADAPRIVQLLISNGSSISSVDNQRFSALHDAVYFNAHDS